MFDEPLMLQLILSVIDIIHTQSNKLAMGVKIKETDDSIVNGSPDKFHWNNMY